MAKHAFMWTLLTIVVFLTLSVINGLLAYTYRQEHKQKVSRFEPNFESKLKEAREELKKVEADLNEYTAQVSEKQLKVAELRHKLSIARTTSKLMQARVEYRSAMVQSIREMTSNIAAARDQLVGYYDEKRGKESDEHRSSLEDLQNKTSSLEQRKNNLDNRIIDMEKVFRDEMARLRTKVDQKRQDIENVQAGRLVTVREDEVDGRVLFVDNQFNFVIIDAGAKQGIKFGQRFKVFQYDSNRVPVEKGFIICRVLGDHVSYGQIIKVNDKINPLLEGDLISSPIYSRDHKVKVAVIGRIEGYRSYADEDMDAIMTMRLKRDIEEYGAIFSPIVSADCDFVVVSQAVLQEKDEGEPSDELRALRLAREFDLQILTEKEFLRFIAN